MVIEGNGVVYHRGIRCVRSLGEICDHLQAHLGWSPFAIDVGAQGAEHPQMHAAIEYRVPTPDRVLEVNVSTAIRLDGTVEGYQLQDRWNAALDALEEQPRYWLELHYWLRSEMQIGAFCTALRRSFRLPVFEHDCENENEWAIIETNTLVVHVSHAYKYGTYHAWNPQCPRGCNYSIQVNVKQEVLDWPRDRWLARLAKLGGGRVQHEGRWHRRRAAR
jgi:hypothetical protein